MNTEIEHLKKMRELLAKGWTQGAWARDGNGTSVGPHSEKAKCFCMLGASTRAGDPSDLEPLIPKSLAKAIGLPPRGGAFIIFNDNPYRTQSDVLALIDRAIEIAEAAQ